MRLALPTAAVLASALVALLLVATRGVDPLTRDQRPVPAWLAPQADGEAPRRYVDRTGREWWRFDVANGGGLRIALPAEAFPDGCEVAWFARRGTPLLLCPNGAASPLPSPERVQTSKVYVHRIAPASLREGAALTVAGAASRESLFVSFALERIAETEVGFGPVFAWGGTRGRSLFSLLTLGFVSLAGLLAIRYRDTGSRLAGIASIAAVFALAALWFDSPTRSRTCNIDAGDDSYYVAYVQNLVNHGDFFRFPASIRFGCREVDHAHGLPGIAAMLSPPLLLSRALPHGKALRGTQVSADELRAMRALSALYAFGAMLLLFATMRLRRGGAAPPSLWDVALPALLLWGSSMPRWTFVRSIFTHSAELFLLCLALYLAAVPAPRRALLRDLLLAAVVGMLFLVRGEYVLVCPVFLLLPRRDATATRTAAARCLRLIPPLAVLVVFAAIYIRWVSHISTGYGRPEDAGLPFAQGAWAVAARIAANARILVESFFANGGILPIAAALALAAFFAPALRRRAATLPVRAGPAAFLAALLFLLNSCFTPALGDEIQHRYALKLYPFALLWLGALLAGERPATCAGRIARAALTALPIVALAANVRLLTDLGGGDSGQNFSLLTNLQLSALPPSGPGATNLRLALWLLLAAVLAAVFSAAFSSFRRRLPTTGPLRPTSPSPCSSSAP